MGRTLKRVPLDFDWPMKETWLGYLNPFYAHRKECRACKGTGYGPEAKRFSDEWYGYAYFDPAAYGAVPLTIDHPAVVAFAERNVKNAPDFYGVDPGAVRRETGRLFRLWRNQWSHHLIQADVDALVASKRLMDFTHRPRTQEQAEELRRQEAGGGHGYWMREPNGYTPTADEVNAWSLSGMGHDGCNQWVCVKARCKREGFDPTCPDCEGHGDWWPTKAHKQLAEAYESIDPPTGVGFQLWETTSEGSPTSPVFATLDELCQWCEGNATTFASETATAKEWRAMLDKDFVCHRVGNAVFI